MQKLIICILAYFTMATSLFAQGGKSAQYYVELDSAVNDENGRLRLKHVLKQEFSKIIQSNTNGTIGNYVGISTKDNNLEFAYSFVNNENVLQITGGGKVSEGVTNVVSDSKLNGGVNLGVNYYRMFGQKDISIVFDEVKALQQKNRELEYVWKVYDMTNQENKVKENLKKKSKEVEKLEAQQKKLEKIKEQLLAGGGKTYIDSAKYVELQYKKRVAEIEITSLKTKIPDLQDSVKQAIARLQQARDTNPNRDAVQQQFEIDSLKTLKPLYKSIQSLKEKEETLKTINEQIKANTFNVTQIEEVVKKLGIAQIELKNAEANEDYVSNFWEWNVKRETYITEKQKNLNKLKAIRANTIELKWFGFGFNLENVGFKLLDSLNMPISDSDLIPSVNVSFTRYINKILSVGSTGRRISYTTLGAKLKYGNNLSTLKELTIESRDSLSANTVSVATQKAYAGVFDDEVFSGQISLDHYRFVGKKGNFGFHGRAQLDLLEDETISSLRVGILFAALKPEDQMSIINFELFYGLNDIFKDGGEDSLFSRNVIGIQTTIPFNFNL